MHKMRMCLSLCFKGWSSSLLDVLNALHEIFICSLGVYLAKTKYRGTVVPES